MIITVYCSGGIKKGPADDDKKCWTDAERAEVRQGAAPHEVRFLHPDDPVADISNTAAVFGRDMHQIRTADFVIVDARERRGIGIGTEMVASRVLGSGLIAVAPPNSWYRKDKLEYRGGVAINYVHPHLAMLADAIVDDFIDAGRLMREMLASGQRPQGIQPIHDAIRAYERHLLWRDPPMQDVLKELERDHREGDH